MDPSLNQPAPVADQEEENEWDTDGFVIPSLGLGDSDVSKSDVPVVTEPKPPAKIINETEKIYLGPHGAPPSQAKQQQEFNSAGRKQRFKQKLKEADHKFSGTGHENKVETLRQLVGGRVNMMPKGSSRDWLDPHCHESHFERYRQ